MFFRNAWYIAAEVPELDLGLVSRTILGQRLVFFRTIAGSLGALEDRCPHRLAPLSFGKVVGDNLRCGYHGAEFGRDGRCVKVPGQSAVAGAVANTPGTIGPVQVQYAKEDGFDGTDPTKNVALVQNASGDFTGPTPVYDVSEGIRTKAAWDH